MTRIPPQARPATCRGGDRAWRAAGPRKPCGRRSGRSGAAGPQVHCFLCAHHCRIEPGRASASAGCGRTGTASSTPWSTAAPSPPPSTPSRRSRSSTSCPAPRPTRSPRWAATSPAASARTPTSARCRADQGRIVGQAACRPSRWWPAALAAGCRSISYTYTEPTIFYEYARDCARLATEAGLKNVFVTNGYMTAEMLADIDGDLHAANVDLKSFSDEFYRTHGRRAAEAGARLHPAAARDGGVGGGDHAAHPRAQRRRRRTARPGRRSWSRSRPTSPGTSPASTPPTGCSTCRPRRSRRWRGRCASGARPGCATCTGATSPVIPRNRRLSRLRRRGDRAAGFRLRKNGSTTGAVPPAAARSPAISKEV